MLTNEQYKLIYEILGRIYAQIQWGKIKTSKNPWDIYNHRVRNASCKPNLNQFISKLCNFFGLQQTSFQTLMAVDRLKEVENAALNTIYKEHIPLCMKGIAYAKELKKINEINKKNKDQKNLFDDLDKKE